MATTQKNLPAPVPWLHSIEVAEAIDVLATVIVCRANQQFDDVSPEEWKEQEERVRDQLLTQVKEAGVFVQTVDDVHREINRAEDQMNQEIDRAVEYAKADLEQKVWRKEMAIVAVVVMIVAPALLSFILMACEC